MKSQKWLRQVTDWRVLVPRKVNRCSISRFLLFLILFNVCVVIPFIEFYDSTTTIIPIIPTQYHEKPSICPRMSIDSDVRDEILSGSTCRPHLTPEAICAYTAKRFAIVPSIEVCKDQAESYQLCRVAERLVNSSYSPLAVKCDFSPCDRAQEMSLEDLDPDSGVLRKHKLPKNLTQDDLGNWVEAKVIRARDGGFGFVFLNCVGRNKAKMSQLLSVLPPQSVFADTGKASNRDKINVNVILLDSISRAHFHRSLPNTVEFLRKTQNRGRDGGSADGRVFEFELFQAVHGHTHQNEHAFFSGSLYPGNFTKKQIKDAPTNVDAFFGTFKHAGYQTLFLEEMCWRELYGLVDSVKTGAHWANFRKKVKASYIDSTGISEAFCKMLARYGGTPLFDEGSHQLCFNGKLLHQYLFDYLTQHVKAVGRRTRSKPLFSYTAIKAAHDDYGVRVQTLDKDLVRLIGNFLNEQNTLTVIYGDHGNTYTSYQSKMEGRREMYHPMLLLILPREIEKRLGRRIVSNLKTNQYRLLNAIDIRAGLVGLANFERTSPIAPKGIFGFIPKNRTCDDIEMTSASICLCEDWYRDMETSIAQLTMAEFSVGQLNDKIQESLVGARKNGRIPDGSPLIFGACRRLRVLGIENVQTRTKRAGSVVTTMDVRVQSGNVVKQTECFSVRVERARETIGTSREMKLLAFDRTSTLGHHKACADASVELLLCVCKKREEYRMAKVESIHKALDTPHNVIKINTCLYVVHHTWKKTRKKIEKKMREKVDVFDVVNTCRDRHFTVTFESLAKDANPSGSSPIVVVLKPRTMYFVGSAMSVVGSPEEPFELRMRVATRKQETDKWGDVEFHNRKV